MCEVKKMLKLKDCMCENLYIENYNYSFFLVCEVIDFFFCVKLLVIYIHIHTYIYIYICIIMKLLVIELCEKNKYLKKNL